MIQGTAVPSSHAWNQCIQRWGRWRSKYRKSVFTEIVSFFPSTVYLSNKLGSISPLSHRTCNMPLDLPSHRPDRTLSTSLWVSIAFVLANSCINLSVAQFLKFWFGVSAFLLERHILFFGVFYKSLHCIFNWLLSCSICSIKPLQLSLVLCQIPWWAAVISLEYHWLYVSDAKDWWACAQISLLWEYDCVSHLLLWFSKVLLHVDHT